MREGKYLVNRHTHHVRRERERDDGAATHTQGGEVLLSAGCPGNRRAVHSLMTAVATAEKKEEEDFSPFFLNFLLCNSLIRESSVLRY